VTGGRVVDDRKLGHGVSLGIAMPNSRRSIVRAA
jgi:hypothetical protein